VPDSGARGDEKFFDWHTCFEVGVEAVEYDVLLDINEWPPAGATFRKPSFVGACMFSLDRVVTTV